MRDGLTSVEKNTLRTRPQRQNWYLARHRPRILGRHSIIGTPNNHPVSAIKLNEASTNAFSVAQPDMTAWVGTGEGLSDLGKVRIRRTMNGSILPIMESGSGLVNWKLVTHVTLVDQYYPWTKHKRFNNTASQWRMDWDEPYTDELNIPGYGPYANLGPPVVGVLNDSGVYSASFYGNRSLFWDSAVATQQWDFPDGQQVTSLLGTCDNPVVMTFNNASPGGSYFSLTVTDADGASHIGRRLIYLMASRSDFPRVGFANIQGGIEQGGYTANLTVYENGNEDNYPEGTEIAIFEESSYNTSASSIGSNYPHRHNIVFRGWITEENNEVTPFLSRTRMTVETINGIMNKSNAYDVFLAAACDGASDWVEATSLCLDRAALFMLKHKSTVGNLVDWQPASGLAISEEIAFQSLPKSAWWQQFQLNYGAKGILGYAAADLQSNLYAFEDVQVTGGSGNLPIVTDITKQDRRDIMNIPHSHQDKNAQAKVLAVRLDRDVSASHIYLGGESPGAPMGYWGGAWEHARGLLTDSQDTLITWAGNMRAKLNNEYAHIPIQMAGNYRLDAVPQHRYTMTLSPNDSVRQINWNNEQFLSKGLRINYNANAGMAITELDVEKIVQGIGGSAITFPREIISPPTDIPLEQVTQDVPELSTDGGGSGGGGGGSRALGFTTVFGMTYDHLGKTSTFFNTSPSWSQSDIGPGAADTAGERYMDFVLDPYEPSIKAYLVTRDALYKTVNLNATTPVWTPILTTTIVQGLAPGGTWNEAYIGDKIITCNFRQGYVGVLYDVSAAGDDAKTIGYAYSNNYGVAWSFNTIYAAPAGKSIAGSNSPHAQVEIVPRQIAAAITVYAVIQKYVGDCPAEAKYTFFSSANDGITWSEVADITGALGDLSGHSPWSLHVPYDSNLTGQIIWSGHNERIYKSTDGGSTWAEDTTRKTRVHRTGVETSTQDVDQVYCWSHEGVGVDTTKLLVSTNGGTDWVEKNATGLAKNNIASTGFPFDGSLFYVMDTDGIHVSTDGGDTFTDKTGDFIGDTNVLNAGDQKRRGVIVPVWNQ
jgi:hypothetical protein